MLTWIASARKFLVTVTGGALSTLALVDKIPFLPHDVHTTVGVAIGFFTWIATYVVPNKTTVA